MTEEQQKFLEGLVKDMTLNLLTYASRTFPDSAAVEDVVNDALEIACRKIGELMASPNPEGWLMETLKYTMMNKKKQLLRREMRTAPVTWAEDTPATSRYPDCDMDIAGTQILGEEDYAVFRRFALKEITAREAAQEWNCTLDAGNKRLQRMRNKLKNALKKDFSKMS